MTDPIGNFTPETHIGNYQPRAASQPITLWGVWCLGCGIVGLFVVLYVVKSSLGIDLVKGSSPFPEFLHSIGVCHNV
jgi:hypothetical protein